MIKESKINLFKLIEFLKFLNNSIMNEKPLIIRLIKLKKRILIYSKISRINKLNREIKLSLKNLFLRKTLEYSPLMH
jgi:hypothetical protein